MPEARRLKERDTENRRLAPQSSRCVTDRGHWIHQSLIRSSVVNAVRRIGGYVSALVSGREASGLAPHLPVVSKFGRGLLPTLFPW